MTILTLGDLATTFQQRLQSARIRTDMARLSGEMASGQKSDLRAATGGNTGMLASLDHQIAALGSFQTSAREAGLFAGSLQTALSAVQDSVTGLGPTLARLASGALGAGTAQNAAWIDTAANDMKAQFSAVVSSLNTRIADRALLGGTATDGRPLADAETMLADLVAVTAGETTAAGVDAAVTAWFDDPGGGFETIGYLGSTADLAPFRVGQDETVSLGITAADKEFRDLFKGYAMGALVSAGTLSAARGERAALMRTAGERMIAAGDAFTNLRGRVGSAEAQIDAAQGRNAAETSALEIARTEIRAADPYETAIELQATQLQLESLYAVTARLSRLNLTEFLR